MQQIFVFLWGWQCPSPHSVRESRSLTRQSLAALLEHMLRHKGYTSLLFVFLLESWVATHLMIRVNPANCRWSHENVLCNTKGFLHSTPEETQDTAALNTSCVKGKAHPTTQRQCFTATALFYSTHMSKVTRYCCPQNLDTHAQENSMCSESSVVWEELLF